MNYTAVNIKMEEIYCDNNFNCRGPIEPYEVIDLANDIKTNFLQTPISVQLYDKVAPYKYRILAGHRRFTAFKVNGADEIPCFIVPITDELEAKAYNLKENLFRTDLNLLQEAKALQPFFDKGIKVSKIAETLNKSVGWVEPRRQLLALPKVVQDEAEKGVINQNHIKSLYALRSKPQEMIEALRKLREQKEKGEKVIVIKRELTAIDLIKVKKPSTYELNEDLDYLNEQLIKHTQEENFGARCLAYAAGNISKIEFYSSVKRECKRLGVPFNPPPDVASIINANP